MSKLEILHRDFAIAGEQSGEMILRCLYMCQGICKIMDQLHSGIAFSGEGEYSEIGLSRDIRGLVFVGVNI